ncbi:hypothetical protein QAD02_013274 [Eretmocerus hayati]|uniref:Uncharacterized protein n=1 Tax=Eretmocerus hayati TaxID=131215 RepID=A0ACC2P4X1_9HYME|nr:hypothetical protein QAD02_013274 [Eretmocerus hayati]
MIPSLPRIVLADNPIDSVLDKHYLDATRLLLTLQNQSSLKYRVYLYVHQNLTGPLSHIYSENQWLEFIEFVERKVVSSNTARLCHTIDHEYFSRFIELQRGLLRHFLREDNFGFFIDDFTLFGTHALVIPRCPFLQPYPVCQPFAAATYIRRFETFESGTEFVLQTDEDNIRAEIWYARVITADKLQTESLSRLRD